MNNTLQQKEIIKEIYHIDDWLEFNQPDNKEPSTVIDVNLLFRVE